MSILTKQEQSALIEQFKGYDYVRFSWSGLNGISRGKTVIGRYAERFIRQGLGIHSGIVCVGPGSEETVVPHLSHLNFGNINFVPATSKIFDLAWADQTYKIGKVICEACLSDGRHIMAQSHTAANYQLSRLKSAGYKLYSASEVECCVVRSDSNKPVYETHNVYGDMSLSNHSDWIFDLEQTLRRLNINVESIHTEHGAGQFEFCMVPKYGINMFDDIIIMKDAMKEILPKYGCKPTFMTCPFADTTSSSGFHFNHSLWTLDGKNTFYDSTKPYKMSDIHRYWLGGLIKHAMPLTVLCNPTPNCFRRLHKLRTPNHADWGIDNRMTAFRVKNANVKSTYIENRLPSSACNPYNVAAATIAAGLDGIENKIEPPKIGQHDSNPYIPTFEECIKALQEDSVLVNALGSQFVEWWVAMKQHECRRFKSSRQEKVSDKDIEEERKYYFDII